MKGYITNLVKRNQSSFGNISEYHSTDRENYLKNLEWAIALNQKLGNLDYQEREKAIDHIKEVLNCDYVNLAGGTLEEEVKKGR